MRRLAYITEVSQDEFRHRVDLEFPKRDHFGMAKQHMEIPYTRELGESICDRLADGESLRKICEGPDMPRRSVLRRWENEEAEFRAMLDAARRHQADSHFENILRIAMDIPEAPIEATSAEISAYKAHIAVAAFQIDTLKWVASRLDPKRYSDRATTRQSEERLDDIFAEFVNDIRSRNPQALEE